MFNPNPNPPPAEYAPFLLFLIDIVSERLLFARCCCSHRTSQRQPCSQIIKQVEDSSYDMNV